MASNFNLKNVDFTMIYVNVYLKQFITYFVSYAVKVEQIVSLILTNISREFYSTLKDLVAPDKL